MERAGDEGLSCFQQTDPGGMVLKKEERMGLLFSTRGCSIEKIEDGKISDVRIQTKHVDQ
jgi:hypothetical protein